MCWILFTHRLPLSSDDEKVLGRQHVSTEEKHVFFLIFVMIFFGIGNQTVFCFLLLWLTSTNTHTQHSDDSPLMQTDNAHYGMLSV